jgi:predicted HicB family RNase H-like nuclease
MAFNKISSREAPKFIIRFPDNTMREEVAAAAAKSFISMNSYALQAISEKLTRDNQPK